MVLTPLAAGALQQHASAQVGYAAVMTGTLLIGVWLVTQLRSGRHRCPQPVGAAGK